MSTFLIGCLHLGHDSVARYRGFKDSWEHDDYLIKQWNETINKDDLVFILGDITMETDEFYFKLDLLNGRKKVVLGNHDLNKHVPELLKYVESVAGMIDYKGCTLTHCPIHPNEVSFYRANIFAHIHHRNKLEEVSVMDKYGDKDKTQYPTLHKYHCVDAHLLDYKPRKLDDILNGKINT